MSTRQPDRPDTSGRKQARQRAAQLHKAEMARQRRRHTALVSGAVLLLLLVVVGLGAIYQSTRSAPSGAVAVPAGVTAGAVPLGQASAPVTVTVYEDFQCPACRAFEQRSGATLLQLRRAGTVRVLYKPIAFLDRNSTDRYSTRALNAAGCLLQQAPQGFDALHSALFAEQPAEGGPGLSDTRLTELVAAAGAPGASSCITGLRYQDWTAQVTDQASRAGVNQTPTVLVNGKPLADTSAGGLQTAVLHAAVAR